MSGRSSDTIRFVPELPPVAAAPDARGVAVGLNASCLEALLRPTVDNAEGYLARLEFENACLRDLVIDLLLSKAALDDESAIGLLPRARDLTP